MRIFSKCLCFHLHYFMMNWGFLDLNWCFPQQQFYLGHDHPLCRQLSGEDFFFCFVTSSIQNTRGEKQDCLFFKMSFLFFFTSPPKYVQLGKETAKLPTIKYLGSMWENIKYKMIKTEPKKYWKISGKIICFTYAIFLLQRIWKKNDTDKYLNDNFPGKKNINRRSVKF